MSTSSSEKSLFVTVNRHTYKLHPVVVFSILDHYKRRSDEQERVVGTLLGEVVGNDVIVKDCFAIPHSEKKDQVTIDMEYHAKLLELHQRVYPRDVVVGWYSTGNEITYVSSLIHQVYAQTYQKPIPMHLTVDTALTNCEMGIRAYVCRDVKAGEKIVVSRFENVKVQMVAHESEKIGVDALINAIPDGDGLDSPGRILTDMDNLKDALDRLVESIETLLEYVNKVKSGEIKGDERIGRAIVHALEAVPAMSPESASKVFSANIQDLLMVVYLSNLTRAQLALSDKIQAVTTDD